MIKYYAYYNYGGYKDLFLGSSNDIVDCRYFLPMLPIYKTDPSMQEKVESWKKLPEIICLSNQTEEYSYPSEARVMMSHAGYKLQYRIIGNEDVFALRDIAGSKDTYGRSCPFVMMFVADTLEDKKRLKILTHYIWCHIQEVENLFSGLFVNDFDVNGLRYEIKSLNGFVDNVVSTHEESIDGNTYNKRILFFTVPDGIRFRNAFEEQQISKNDVALAYDESQQQIFRYEPPQVIYGPAGSAPVINQPSQERPVAEKEQESHNSIRSSQRLAKEEDLQQLVKAQNELRKRIECLENRIKELENKIL